MDLTKQVKENTEAIKELQRAQERIERDHDNLLTLYKTQQATLTELKTDVKSDILELKKDLRDDIQDLGKRHDQDVQDAKQAWPNRAHLAVECVLGVAALWGMFHH
ncbi:hypothetical protein [Alicyclobacillus dauci]|uniref:Uncharacterized protein n=1 Tax=Alicyclobacillus dauci TaxID=1475485 RepID=A0ABY6Z652_9BACL|nr:hypothetical protein [Alicyclobacillus dauci]WAH38244.1 hypothetical protein NZD86_07115 [Alicyclobacillus dauci]